MLIKIDDLRGPEIAALLTAHLNAMHENSPPESVHALDIEKLRKPDITFWSIWDGESLAGCGALKELDRSHAEVKSMRTARPHLRKGYANRLLEHMIGEARQRDYRRISLETGSMAYFEPAHQLYKKYGFIECGPFADYREDPHSIFMTLKL